MQWLIGLAAVLGTFAVPLFWIKTRHERRKLEIEQKSRLALPPGNPEEVKQLTAENKLLRERVENLESIVCSVDYELNQKLAKMIDESRAGHALPAPAPAKADD